MPGTGEGRKLIALAIMVPLAYLTFSSCSPDRKDAAKTSAPQAPQRQLAVTSPPGYDPYAWVAQDEALIDPVFLGVAKNHLGPNEHVIHAMKRVMRYTKQQVFRLALFDKATNATRKIDVDQNGALLDYQAVNASNRALGEMLHGNFTDELDALITNSASATDTAEIEIWYKAPAPPPRTDATLPTRETDEKLRRMKHVAALSAARAQLVADLQSWGGTILFEASYAPIVEAKLPLGVINAKLRSRTDVAGVGVSNRNVPRKNNSLDGSKDIHMELFHQDAYNGASIKVGISDGCDSTVPPGVGPGIALGPYLVFSDYRTMADLPTCSTDANCQSCDHYSKCLYLPGVGNRCFGGHVTHVAGMIGLEYQVQWAGAFAANIYHANGGVSHAALLDWQVGWWLVQVTNESWGAAPPLGDATNPNAQDYYIRNFCLSLTRAAGNDGVSATPECKAMNIICVAGHNPQYTPGVWSDDTFYNKSSTANFPDCPGPSLGYGCDREVPDITAHGEACSTTAPGVMGLVTDEGTSLAAPQIAGLVALMMEKAPILSDWPESVRAILMASANHDVDHPAGLGKTYSDYRWPDERDGAGVPNAQRIMTIIGTGSSDMRWDGYQLRPTDFDVNHEKTLKTVCVGSSTRLRAVIAWDNCPDGYQTSGPTGISTDFDLRVYDPNGNLVEGGASWDGSQEILEVTGIGGCYTIKVKYFQWNPCYGQQDEYLGFAWDAY